MKPASFLEAFGTPNPDPARLGGKGASLSRLVRLGHRVPPGFVLTVDAFLATIRHLGLAGASERLTRALAAGRDLEEPGGEIRRGLREGRLPSAVLEPVLRAVDELRLWADNEEGVIIRSSATVEDSAAHSFAGIFESITVGHPDELEPAIREVWASVFSPRALAYVRETGIREVPAMAVVVQRFLDAWRSGVMFTRFDGPDGEPRVLVEHVEGGCEKLVKGEVTPERLWLAVGAAGHQEVEGLLPGEHVRELARLAADLEDVFGEPQDVEWVIHGDAVHLVQSRPVTVPSTGGSGSLVVEVEGLTPLLRGVGASPGAGAGVVHLVFNIDQALRLERGQVLVTPMTNPDMVVAMRNSAGIVTDVGGIICHAAIVSRELGLPCVVGTERATVTLSAGASVTVDGTGGAVYEGRVAVSRTGPATRPMGWEDLWTMWIDRTAGRPDLTPVVSTVEALRSAPEGLAEIVLIPDLDLRSDGFGLWQGLEGLPPDERGEVLAAYVRRVAEIASGRSLPAVHLLPLGALPEVDLSSAASASGQGRVDVPGQRRPGAPPLVLDPGRHRPDGPAAVPLGSVAGWLADGEPEPPGRRVGGVDEALTAALDTVKFFGHVPGVKVAPMPDPGWRERWWDLLPEYGRFHREEGTAREVGEFEWLEVRPELVISALLKSLVQPGFEMVPRVLGFRDLPPMHIKWIRCRYHFRSDVFAKVWAAIVRMTWDQDAMADLMRRVRRSYEQLREVLALFPQTDADLAAVEGPRMVAAITSWWPRWVEFFALCWFIQAQGDDVAYPFVDETVRDDLVWLGPPPTGLTWPGQADLVAPTTPVMSGEYMADVGRLRQDLLAAGFSTVDAAMSALQRGEEPAFARRLEAHLARWGWMRDRDLLFEPWDTPRRVIDTALRTEPHAVLPYAENLRRQHLALGFHMDLAHATGRALGLNHSVRFLHDLNVERENHHVLWLKYSYPLRQLCLEIERRLVAVGSLEPGEIFFLQAPELIDAAGRLPAPLPTDVVTWVRNRRAGFLREAKLAGTDGPAPADEDDYY